MNIVLGEKQYITLTQGGVKCTEYTLKKLYNLNKYNIKYNVFEVIGEKPSQLYLTRT